MGSKARERERLSATQTSLSRSLVIFFLFVDKMDILFAKLIWCRNEPFPRTHGLAGWIPTDIHGAEHTSRAAGEFCRDTSDHSTVSNIFTPVKGLYWLKQLDGYYNDL